MISQPAISALPKPPGSADFHSSAARRRRYRLSCVGLARQLHALISIPGSGGPGDPLATQV